MGGNWIDIVGSTIIGGIVMLLLFGVNAQISSTSANTIRSTYASRNIIDAAYIIEHDFYKIGYRVNTNIITVAEENKIEFKADLDNDSIPDVVTLYLGTIQEASGTYNPKDRPLYRKINTNSQTVSFVREFKVSYLDSIGNEINYSLLTNQTVRDQIYGFEVYIKIESDEPIDGIYPFIEWKRTIIPKNMVVAGDES
jgi:hypothetical protein